MAKYQYRIAGELDWMSTSGNAILAIFNPPGSGKKLTIRSLEATNMTSTNTGTAGTVSAAPQRGLSLVRATLSGGQLEAPTPLDSTAAAWPATVPVTTGAAVSSPGLPLVRYALLKQMNQNSLSWLGMAQATGPAFSSVRRAPKRGGVGTENVVIRAGESVAVYPDTGVQGVPIRINATLVRSGSPNRTYMVTFFAQALEVNRAVLGIENQVGSGETITLIELAVEEVGTYDSPYFQIVPMGPMDSTAYADPSKVVTPLPMDSAYPSPSSWLKALADVPFLPLGLPENALSDGGAGSPKGFNYLKSKDFIGPVYRAYFPEFVTTDLRAALPDALHYNIGHRNTDLFFRRAGVTLREGEGIAIVSGAETAVVAYAVGVSGWSSWHFAAQVDVEPSFSPTLTLTGLKVGTEVRIFDAGTTTLLAGEETINTGTFSWVFDPSEHPSVDISILALGYQNMRLTSFALSLANVTVPIQQIIDRQYSNA